MILVTGASGTVGGAVAGALRELKQPFRSMVRKNPQSDEVAADFADNASLNAALKGIHTVFLVCSPTPDLVELESNAIDACVEAGVKHVVLNSSLGAEDYPKSFPSWHRQVEDKLKASGLDYSILRPNSFMQNIVAFQAPTIRSENAFHASAGNAKYSYIDVRDIGTAAANILGSPEPHAGQIYELNGPEAVTYAELATRISQVAGRPVKYIDIPEEAQRQAMLGQGMPEWQVTAVLDLQRYYVDGQGGEVTGVLPSLLGHASVTLDRFLAEFKDSFLPATPTAE